MSNDQPSTNRLAEESSPYLLQHAHNPVDWYPWGPEAFEAAARQDKPVFLSIGYATCHWCHVMAHESFEDPEVAARMNETFINIKVDREERPDIDKTYMLVCQMLSGSGGWPLNVFLTPDKKPFYAATYIPKNERQGRPGMLDLIPWIARLWQNERDKIIHSTNKVVEGFQKSTAFTAGSGLGRSFLEEAVQEFRQKFDQQHGGFGSAPKFPSAHNLMFLLRYHHQTGDTKALQMVKKTLTHMRRGGLFDHIGRGFHRYSTDQRWLVPHFEKMLYDQAMLLMVYTEAWQCTQNPLFRQTAEEIIDYLLRKMQHPEGGFYSAEDADSEGKEGKFYVWSAPEIRDILDSPEAELALEIFNITEEGNYRDEASGRRTGKSIPHLQKSIEELAGERDLPVHKLQSLIEQIRSTLFEKRQQRTHPLLDDKILTDWNGLAIAALAKAGLAFENQFYLQEARRCYDFIARHLQQQGALKHRYRNEEAGIEALADDYAFLIWGLTELYEATFETPYLEEAIKFNRQFIDQFWDDEDGGFYFTSESGEKLLGRKKEIYDGALPSSNSVALSNLLRLGRLTGTTEWEDKAETINRLFSADIKRAPTGFGQALQGIAFADGSSSELILSGKKEDALTGRMQDKLAASFLPFTVSVLNDPNDELIRQLVPYLSHFEMRDDQTTAYVCQNYSCERPTHDPQQMENLIRASNSDSNS